MDTLDRDTEEDDMFLVLETLPSVVVTHILTYLKWQDKLNTCLAFPAWQESLSINNVWTQVVYKEVTFKAQEERRRLSECIRKYGNYMTSLSLSFRYALGNSGSQIMRDIEANCSRLRKLEFSGTIWDSHSGFLFCRILSRCTKLKEVSLIKPSLVWGAGESNKDSVLVPLVKEGHATKVTRLILCSDSLVDHEGPLDILGCFTNLKVLRVRREELSDSLLLHLARHSLMDLSLFQYEELALTEPLVYTTQVWEKVLQSKPNFQVNIVLRNVILLRSLFPVMVPLRALVLVDLSASLTKGIIDTITSHYHKTLEVFVYTKSYVVGCAALEDRRLPVALTELVQQCKNLHTLVYGFEISSTTALLLAHRRKLRHFAILLEELSFEFDWRPEPEWSPEFLDWLRQSGKSMADMEREISRLLGYEWKVATEHNMFHNVNYFTNI